MGSSSMGLTLLTTILTPIWLHHWRWAEHIDWIWKKYASIWAQPWNYSLLCRFRLSVQLLLHFMIRFVSFFSSVVSFALVIFFSPLFLLIIWLRDWKIEWDKPSRVLYYLASVTAEFFVACWSVPKFFSMNFMQSFKCI